MKIGLVGGSYQMLSLPFDAQRSVNFFPVADKQGKEVSSLYMTPGLSLFATAGSGGHRGSFTASNDRAFFVSGSGVYEGFLDGTTTLRGSLNQSSGGVTFADNGFQLAICDGVTLYILTYATNAFAQVTHASFPGAATVTFIDGYFVVNDPDTGKFYISSLYDGFTWGALDFKSAESEPDNLKLVIEAAGNLWGFGKSTIEIFVNSGGSAASRFPFQKISGATIDIGIIATYSAVVVAGSILFVGKDAFGRGAVYEVSGLSPERRSTEAIELKLQSISSIENLTAFMYQEHGHLFYILTGGGLSTSLVYDLTTKLWHERAYLNEDGIQEAHLGISCTYAFGKHLVGDRRNGNIYHMSLDYYDDNGEEILRQRIYTHLSDEDKRIRYNTLTIGVDVGNGKQTGNDINPSIVLRISKDGGKTWSNPYTKPTGRVGQFRQRVSFRRLGIASQMTFELRTSSRVKTIITGSYLT